jgi:hypothetical protein
MINDPLRVCGHATVSATRVILVTSMLFKRRMENAMGQSCQRARR